MALNVSVRPEDLWDYIEDYAIDLSIIPEQIAKSEDERTLITLEVTEGVGELTVTIDDELVEDEFIQTPEMAEEILSFFYEEYGGVVDDKGVDVDDEDDDEENRIKLEIAVREDELEDATMNFVWTVWDGDAINTNEIPKIMEKLLDFLHKEYPKRKIYRPMLLEDTDGTKVFEEYPYGKYEW